MTTADLLLILILPAAILLAGFCAAAETAVFSLTPTDRARLRRASPGRERDIARLLSRPRLFLLSVLLLTNLANVLYFVVGSVLERRMSGHGLGLLVNVALLVMLIMAADLLPKLLSRSRRVAFCRIAAPLLVLMARLVGPVCRVLEAVLIEPIMRLVRPAAPSVERDLTAEELGALLDLSARSGAIAEDEQRLLSDVVDLGQTRVRDVMTPRVAMAWVADTSPPARIREVVQKSGQTELPAFRGSLDGGPVGMLDVRRYFPAVEAGAGKGAPKLGSFLSRPLFVPESARLDQLLDAFRRSRRERALCVDEFGAVVGIVGIGDVMSQLVAGPGPEVAGGGGGVARVGEDRWVVPGRLPARELAEYFFGPAGGRALDARVSTVAGLIYARLGRVPQTGDTVRLGNVALSVESMAGRAVERVAVSVAPAGAGARP
jgi:CBS domain containing-hemolysin-like protein